MFGNLKKKTVDKIDLKCFPLEDTSLNCIILNLHKEMLLLLKETLPTVKDVFFKRLLLDLRNLILHFIIKWRSCIV